MLMDKSKFDILGRDGKLRVRTKPNTAMVARHLLPTVTRDGG